MNRVGPVVDFGVSDGFCRCIGCGFSWDGNGFGRLK